MRIFKKYWLKQKRRALFIINHANELLIKEGHEKEWLEIQSLKEDLIKLLQKKRYKE